MIISPVASPLCITQHFGERPEVYAQFGLKGHNGIDFTGETSGDQVDIFTPYDCTVTDTGFDEGYGNYVYIETPVMNGKARQLIFGHLSFISVKKGDIVSLGDKIGVMGSTGFSSGVHLHLGLRFLDGNGNVLNEDNGYKGYIDFEPYLLFWLNKEKAKEYVAYPLDE